MESILIGTTDRTITVFIPDPASTDGSGKTGLAHTDMTVSYIRTETDNDVVISDATSSLNALTNLTDAHNDWGWKEVSNTLAPGLYRLDLADALFATGAWTVDLYVMITTSAAAATPKKFKLVNFDMYGQSASDLKDFADDGYDPATNKVQGVVLTDTCTTTTTATNLTNAPTNGDLTATMKTSVTTAATAATPVAASVTGNVGGNVTGTVGSVVTKTGYSLASTGLDLVLVDTKTLPEALQIIGASTAGKISGAGTGTEVFLGLDGSTTRITVTVDSSGNRTTVVYA